LSLLGVHNNGIAFQTRKYAGEVDKCVRGGILMPMIRINYVTVFSGRLIPVVYNFLLSCSYEAVLKNAAAKVERQYMLLMNMIL
jgi:hypothetical protein